MTYKGKSEAELRFIIADASSAAKAMQGHDARAEGKYLDQVNEASSELGRRLRLSVARRYPGARTLRVGTSHFVDVARAQAYYLRQGFGPEEGRYWVQA